VLPVGVECVSNGKAISVILGVVTSQLVMLA